MPLFDIKTLDEQAQRAAVIAEARTWLGTPFRDQADIKGVGIDCGLLLTRCFVDTRVKPPFDPRPYPPRRHLHERAEKYIELIERYAVETTEAKPANIAVYKFGLCYSHGGILIGGDCMISALLQHAMVTIQELWGAEYRQPDGSPVPVRYFDPWGKRAA